MKQTPGLLFIFITLLLDVLGFGLVIPILPDFIAHLSHHGISGGARDYGILLALYGVMQFLFAPLVGALSDRFGRRPVLLFSLLFGTVDYVVTALAPTLTWLYVGRTLSGIAGASFTTGSAYIADVSPPEKRAQNFGLIGAAFGVGFIVGPALGGLIGTHGPRAVFWAAAGLSLVNLVYGYFGVPESLKPENRRRFALREANPIGALAILGRYPIVWGLTGALAFTGLAMSCLQSTWVLWAKSAFDWGPKQTGLSLAAFGVVSLIYQVGVARVLLPRLGEKRTVLVGLAVGAAEFVGYALANQGWQVYAIMFVAGINSLVGQATQGLLSRQVGEDEQGALQGALTSLQSVTGIVGPPIATFLFAYFTRPGRAVHVPGAAFFLAAAFDVAALVLSIRALRHFTDAPQTLPNAPDAVPAEA